MLLALLSYPYSTPPSHTPSALEPISPTYHPPPHPPFPTPKKLTPPLPPPDFTDPTNPLNKPNTLPPPTTASTPSSKRYLWSLPFYAQFFDVDTSSVLSRCLAALYPRSPFLDTLEGNPDLYGPFWIATTVVFILFITGTISQYLAWKGAEHFAYDFRLLSGAAGLVYGYTLVVPVVLWGLLRWYGASTGSAAGGGAEGISPRGVLGAVRVWQYHLDTGGVDQLEPDHGAELGVCGGWVGG